MADKPIEIITSKIPQPRGLALFSIPAGAVVDTHSGRLRVTEPSGCRYLLKGVTVATGPEAFTLSAGIEPRPVNPSTRDAADS